MKKRALIYFLIVALLVSQFCGCGGSDKNPNLDTSEEITIRVVGPWEDFSALEAVTAKFVKKYKNVTVEYEYVQDYYNSIEKRLSENTDDIIDIFLTTNIQSNNRMLPYAYELYSDSRVDLSDTFEGLVHNFELMSSDENNRQIYSVPLGAEIRGMYVNVTLLKSLKLEIPTNLEEFLNVCEIVKENGYIPMGGNPGLAAQHFLFPYVCNIIVNSGDYEKTYNMVNNREAGASELFRSPMQLMYDMSANRYYDYKTAEDKYGMFKDSSAEGYARDFFNIQSNDGGETYEKADDTGMFAFVPNTMSCISTMDKIKDDYHSKIEYAFILSPVSDDGGFAYMSPAHGIAINKGSEHMDWTIEFFNFIFEEENNKLLAEGKSYIPNTKDAFDYITENFDIPENHISELGQMTFDYAFYDIIVKSLTNAAKSNNPKYMQTNSDGTVTMYDFEYYMQQLEKALTNTVAE